MTWAQIDEIECPCHGNGWAEVDENWKQCPIHFNGQLHPDTRTLLLDEPNRLAEEERKSRLQFEISLVRDRIKELQALLALEQAQLLKLDLELVNRTPTVRAMPAIILAPPPPAVEVVEELDWGDIFTEDTP